MLKPITINTITQFFKCFHGSGFVEKRIFVVEKIVYETPYIRTFRLVPADGKPFPFKPGQVVNLHVLKEDRSFGEGRPYSLSSSPTEGNFIELTIKMEGNFPTTRVANFKEGDCVGINGPFGLFAFDETAKEIVMVAGGCGVTPFRSFVRYAADKKLPARIVLFYSCKTQEELVSFKEFDAIAAMHSNFSVVPTLTKETPAGWKGETGRLDEEKVRKHVQNLREAIFYLCGPAPMVQALVELLKGMGVEEKNIKREVWGK
jgi:ferredoxin-NADP reductase